LAVEASDLPARRGGASSAVAAAAADGGVGAPAERPLQLELLSRAAHTPVSTAKLAPGETLDPSLPGSV